MCYNGDMKILENKITKTDLFDEAEVIFDDAMVKAVVDINKGIVAVDAELHADLEQLLLKNGSNQEDLWGINLWKDMESDDFVEFDSMVNVRPRQNNRSRYVEDAAVRDKIIKTVESWIK